MRLYLAALNEESLGLFETVEEAMEALEVAWEDLPASSLRNTSITEVDM